MLDPPRPRRDDQTICTAVAPDAIRTVRTYATAAGYGHRLVRKSRPLSPLQASKHGKPSSEPRSIGPSQVIRVESELTQESLDPLPGVADESAPDDAFGRSRV